MDGKRYGDPPKNHKIIALAVLIGLALTASGCLDESSSGSSSSGTSSSSISSEVSSSSASGEVSSGSFSSEVSSSSASSEISSSSFSGEASSSSASSEVSSGSSFSSEKSSSSAQSSIPSSSSTPEPPPIAVIPDFEVPTSPGTEIISSDNAVVDYSNASKGYVSVKYTGKSQRVKLRYVCGEKTYNFDVSTDGTVEYFPLSCGSGSYTFFVFERLEGNIYTTALQKTVDIKVKSSTEPYSYPNSYVDYNKKSLCVKKAAELCAGKTSMIDKISAVFLYISDNITYDHELAATVKSGYIPDPDKTLNSKKGICFDYSSLMAAMLRSQGIPTRLVIGYASPQIYHAWNEVYTEQTGWITPELLMKNSGYNIADATFYASAKDKQTISDYIMNNTNYSAVYYY